MSALWDTIKEGATQGLRVQNNAGAQAAGIVWTGLTNTVEAALQNEEVRGAAVEAIAGGVRAGKDFVVERIRGNFDQLTAAVGEGLNAENVGLWSALKDRVVGGSTGRKKLLRFCLAGMLWCGFTLGSYIGAGAVRVTRLKEDANIQQTAGGIRRAVAGLLTPNRRFDPARIDHASNLVTD